MRSLLFVPGDAPRKLEKAIGSGADMLLIDLEDSVSQANKSQAREITCDFIKQYQASAPCQLYVRVNAFDTGLTQTDIKAVMAAKPDGLMLPKCDGIGDFTKANAILDDIEGENGPTKLLPIITETSRSLLNINSFQNPQTRLAGLTWGAEDLSADIGAQATRDENAIYCDVFRYARTMTLLAANACQTSAIDTVFIDFRDMVGFENECKQAVRDGFTGKMAIHPAQVEPINRIFTPSADAIAQAQAIIDAFATSDNAGVIGVNGVMVDKPHLRRAERLIALTKAP